MPRKRNARLTQGFGRIPFREGDCGLTESPGVNVERAAVANAARLILQFVEIREYVL
jgi:hypothetical protein